MKYGYGKRVGEYGVSRLGTSMRSSTPYPQTLKSAPSHIHLSHVPCLRLSMIPHHLLYQQPEEVIVEFPMLTHQSVFIQRALGNVPLHFKCHPTLTPSAPFALPPVPLQFRHVPPTPPSSLPVKPKSSTPNPPTQPPENQPNPPNHTLVSPLNPQPLQHEYPSLTPHQPHTKTTGYPEYLRAMPAKNPQGSFHFGLVCAGRKLEEPGVQNGVSWDVCEVTHLR